MKDEIGIAYPVTKDLIQAIVYYAGSVNDEDFSQPVTYRFIANSPEEKAKGIMEIIFGKLPNSPSKVGNRSFLEKDKIIIREIIKRYQNEGVVLDDLFDEFAPKAASRFEKKNIDALEDNEFYDDESQRERLKMVYRKYGNEIKKEMDQQGTSIDMSADAGKGLVIDLKEDEIFALMFYWINKYRSQLINLLKV